MHYSILGVFAFVSSSFALATPPHAAFTVQYYQDYGCTTPATGHNRKKLFLNKTGCYNLNYPGAVIVGTQGTLPSGDSECTAFFWTSQGCGGGNYQSEFTENGSDGGCVPAGNDADFGSVQVICYSDS